MCVSSASSVSQCRTRCAQVDIWDHERSEPVASYSWGSDSVAALRFNPAEPDVLASAGSDRSIALYDLRSGTPIRKIVMQVRSREQPVHATQHANGRHRHAGRQ